MPILELNGISKKFGALTVAEQISFAVEPGEALGIIGPNGAGKSTLFNLITGNIAPDSGTIRFRGEGGGNRVALCTLDQGNGQSGTQLAMESGVNLTE